MAISENPNYPRFNDSSVPRAAHSMDWLYNQRASAPGADSRQQRQSRPYFTTNLTGLILNEAQKDYLMWLNMWAAGNVKTVLMRVALCCELGVRYDRWASGAWKVRPELLGVGVGVELDFQLRKRFWAEGFEGQDFYMDVTKPHIDYPVLKNISGNPYDPMAPVQIWSSPSLNVFSPLTRGTQWEVDRDTGIVTSDYNGDLYVSGGFYIPMLLPKIPYASDPESIGFWKIGDAQLTEPPADTI